MPARIGKRALTNVESVAKHNEEIRNLKMLISKEGIECYHTGERDGIPKVVNPKRKERCRKSLKQFCLEYLPHQFPMAMSDGQTEDLEIMQKVAVKGGRFAFADPRGDGKTTRTEAAVLWAALFGHRRCIGIIGADLTAAQDILDSIKMELRTNELLREDFPIPCWASEFTDGSALKAKVLHWNGDAMHMTFSKVKLSLPIGEHFDGSGCVLFARGITGRLRGMRVKVLGKSIRPDMYAVDDPQTDESADSPVQCDTRERLLLGAVLGSGGPGEVIACFMPCTIIKLDDMASRMLDRKRHPSFQGRVRGLIKTWPKQQETLWTEYIRIRREDGATEATEFYRQNRVSMDEGAVADWQERYNKEHELSALQHAENLLCDLGEEVFYAEYQNQPREKHLSVYTLNAGVISSRTQKRREYVVPKEAAITVAFTDLNEYGLHWACVAFANDATAWVVSYGVTTGPQGRNIVPDEANERERKQAMYEALVRNGETISTLPLTKDDRQVSVDLWVIDRGYLADVVGRYVSEQGRALGIPCVPSFGFPAEKYRPNSKNLIGAPRENVHLSDSQYGQFLAFQQHYWAEVAQRAWLGSMGAPGSLSLFAGRSHMEFAEQVAREKLVEKIESKTHGTLWVWARQPGRHDYGDTMYGCYIAAAWLGIGSQGVVMPKKRKTQRRVRHVKV